MQLGVATIEPLTLDTISQFVQAARVCRPLTDAKLPVISQMLGVGLERGLMVIEASDSANGKTYVSGPYPLTEAEPELLCSAIAASIHAPFN